MKRFFLTLLISTLIVIPIGNAAAKKISVQPLKLIGAIANKDDVAGAVVSGKTILLFGTAVDRSFVRAVDLNGTALWSIVLDPDSPSIATAGTLDGEGNIWIAGTTSLERQSPLPTPTPILNPDNLSNTPDVFIPALNTVALWKIPAGQRSATLYTARQPAAVLINGIAVDKNGASLVGLTQGIKGSSGFLISANALGEFGAPLIIGSTSTALDAVVRQSDGSLTLTGASGEGLAGKKLVGLVDAVVIKISKGNKTTFVLRSSAYKAKRSWSSASTSLLLGGEVVSGAKSESAVTKFTNSLVPQWTYRFATAGPIFTLGATQVIFSSTAPIAALSNWAPKNAQPILLRFDLKGAIVQALSAPKDQSGVIALINSKELGTIALTSNADLISIFSAS